jgi:hypothetical protein
MEYQFAGTEESKSNFFAIFWKKALLLLASAKNFAGVPGEGEKEEKGGRQKEKGEERGG